MKGLLRAPLFAAIVLIALFGIAGCKSPRIHREDNKPRLARKPADSPIDAFVGKLSRPYEKIAVVDSERYKSNDKESKLRMIEDLKKRARQVGADAVQNLQVLNVQIQGAIPDENVPVPGAWTRGTYKLFFMRGEAVKYIEKVDKIEFPVEYKGATEQTTATAPTTSTAPTTFTAPTTSAAPEATPQATPAATPAATAQETPAPTPQATATPASAPAQDSASANQPTDARIAELITSSTQDTKAIPASDTMPAAKPAAKTTPAGKTTAKTKPKAATKADAKTSTKKTVASASGVKANSKSVAKTNAKPNVKAAKINKTKTPKTSDKPTTTTAQAQ